MVRFLVDEDMPISSTDVFEAHGYPTNSVHSLGMRGTTDREIMDRAFQNGEIIVTREKDFGDLIRYPRDTHPGAVIVRLPYTYTAEKFNACWTSMKRTSNTQSSFWSSAGTGSMTSKSPLPAPVP